MHEDGKSHSGTVVWLEGTAPVYASSKKQKIVTKSSYEAELVALSDGASQVIWSRDFLMSQGYKVRSAVIKQDNKSTIVSAEKGRSTSDLSRHINIRYFWVKDKIDSEDVMLEYTPTEDMIADLLTKPLQGQLFITFT